MKKRSSYSRLQADVRKLKTPLIEVWENQYQDKEYTINLDFPEFTCLCPKTDLPDFAVIHIRYSPDKECLELKSLKMYLFFYRSIGIFHEHAVNKILEDLVRACRPRWLMVNAEFNVRGGIKTTVTAEYNLKK